MAYEDYTIRQFERAWHFKDYSQLPEEIFTKVYDEYVDTTGAYMGSHFDKVVYIRILQARINTINKYIVIQQMFLEEFGQPHLGKLKMLYEYGHSLSWNKSKENFIQQLEDIKIQESVTTSDLQVSLKEYDELQKSEPKQEYTEKQRRENWINTVNSLVKLGYTIDKDKMMVEEVSYIIKYEKEQMVKNG